jgi:hypothetical protein
MFISSQREIAIAELVNIQEMKKQERCSSNETVDWISHSTQPAVTKIL